MQRLEDRVLPDSGDLHLRGDAEDSTPTRVPAKVREIITKNLTSDGWTSPPSGSMLAPTVDHLKEENRMLQLELERLEKLLANTRSERDELNVKYSTISEKVG